jgi:alkyl hydroperoxide reductase subunit AhpC
MTRIGTKVRPFRVPAFLDNHRMTYLDSQALLGKVAILLFAPRLALPDIAVLRTYSGQFAAEAPAFLVIMPKDQPLERFWLDELTSSQFVVLADPIGRLHRQYGLNGRGAPTRCHSFLIDPQGCLRFQLVHDLDERGMKALLEVLVTGHAQEVTVTSHNPKETTHAANL